MCACVIGGPLACVSSDGGVKAVGPYVSEGKGERGETDRDGGERRRRFLPVPPGWDREGGERGMAANRGDRASVGIGEEEWGSPKRLTPAALVLGGGG